ncbi:polysaccharide lyase family 7 protein [Pseudomonas sp. Marseille-Q5115]|uniref:polysaccharide lyase family 7 protein n=1 Tax=Pseudomonas sp. Marseille-Q5115 TaxID=2866593 RepID=UPI001CE3D92F|nr:polysaccharide lyase family 7 protein [Pseudomonas sp. Marseille-Q5115]
MIDLSCFNLTIPAGASVIPTKVLNSGYQDPFFQRQADGSITFIAPSNGVNIKSTKNSTYPRSELRETLTNGDDKEANWKPASAELHSLEAEIAVQELPKSKKAIIGQIHGETDHPPLKIQITDTTIYAQLRRKLDGDEDKPVLLKGYTLGQFFTYRFEISKDGKAKFFINGKQVVNDTLPAEGYQFDMASYAKDTWYFKAGIYSQEKVGGTGTGRATFRALKAYHGPAQVAQPSTPAPAPVPTPAPAPTPAPTTPATPKPTTPAADGEDIKDKLSEMEDVLDDLPDAAVTKLRQLIDAVRGMVA